MSINILRELYAPKGNGEKHGYGGYLFRQFSCTIMRFREGYCDSKLSEKQVLAGTAGNCTDPHEPLRNASNRMRLVGSSMGSKPSSVTRLGFSTVLASRCSNERCAPYPAQCAIPGVLSRGLPEHSVAPHAPPMAQHRPLSASRHFDHKPRRHLGPSGVTYRPIHRCPRVRHGWPCRRHARLRDSSPSPDRSPTDGKGPRFVG